MKVIGVVGLPASGKGEFSRIAGEMGIPIVVMGDVIREAVQQEGLFVTDANLGAVANRLRREEGMDAIARRCVPRIRGCNASLVLVDGIRGDAEVSVFREEFSGFFLVGIDAPFQDRLKRLSLRGREDDFSRPEALVERDQREISWGLGRALSSADHTLFNGGTLEEFSRASRQLLMQIMEDP
ncbi:MAG: flagellar hook-basal body complex protein FliE [Methanolinea sp.]|jgi:dephospho-CoA kinase|nr:flagellar hook-basal body complex protein FliE [Methanolinea sp.]